MTEYEQQFQANPRQAESWNEGIGRNWVWHQEAIDALLHPISEELIVRAAPMAGEQIIDIGCGSGATVIELGRAVGPTGKVAGIDISAPLLDLARKRCRDMRQVHFENVDAQVHSFPESQSDLVVSRFGVMFFSDPYAAFRNIFKALRKNGRLHFICWAPLDQNPWFTIPLNVAKRHLGEPESIPPRTPGPLAFSEPEYVRDILHQASFRNIQIEEVRGVMTSSDSPRMQAELYLSLGPATRLIAARNAGVNIMEALIEELAIELGEHESSAGISLASTAYAVSAER